MKEARNSGGVATAQYFDFGESINATDCFWSLDHLGSVREMTTTTGAMVDQRKYDAFGRSTQIQGSMPSDFQYAGYYNHSPSGLNLAIYRAYNSAQGRWLNVDPIGELGFSTTPKIPSRTPEAVIIKSMKGNLSTVRRSVTMGTHDPMLRAQRSAVRIPKSFGRANVHNLYTYVNNAPVIYVDPRGLAIEFPHFPWWPAPSCPSNPNGGGGCHPPHGNEGWDAYDCYDWCAANCSSIPDYDDCTVECDEWY